MKKIAWYEAIWYTAAGSLRLATLSLRSLFGHRGSQYLKNLDALRARFNEGKGKVRLLLLLSPT